MVPAEAAEVARTTLAALGLADACCVVGVTDAAAALAEIGLALPGLALPGRAVATIPRPAPTSTAPTASPTANRPRWRPLLRLRPRRLTLLVAAGLLLPLALVACWPMIVWHRTVVDWTAQAEAGDLIALDQRLADVAGTPSCLTCAFEVGRFRDWLATRRPPAGAPLVEVEETRRTTYTSCRAGGDAAPAVRRALTEAGAPGEPGVCHARYVVSGAPYVAIVLSAPVLLAGRDVAAVAAGEASVMLDVPPLWFYPTEERVVVLGSKLPLDRVLVWLRPLLPPPPADLPAAVVARLASLGVSARVVRHRIDPGRAM
jgi:hypothetical protein